MTPPKSTPTPKIGPITKPSPTVPPVIVIPNRTGR